MGSDNNQCTKVMPCTKVAKALATGRAFVKFHGTTDEAVTVKTGRVVTFLADPGAKLTLGSSGAIITVRDDNTNLSIFDLSISDAQNVNSIGIVVPPASGAPTVSLTRASVNNNPGGGISAAGGTLTITQSTILGNTGGGITTNDASFDITNSFVIENGGPMALVGGINLAAVSGAGAHRVDFNTIANNAGASTVNSGVNCGTVLVAMTFSNNIIFGNAVSGGGKQIGGSANCLTTYSDIGPDSTTATGNRQHQPRSTLHRASAEQLPSAADLAREERRRSCRDTFGRLRWRHAASRPGM